MYNNETYVNKVSFRFNSEKINSIISLSKPFEPIVVEWTLFIRFFFVFHFPDNPSYFTLPGTSKSKSSGFSALIKKKTTCPSSKSSRRSNSISSLTQSPQKSKLTRSLSATSDVDSHLVALGNPRPADIDPAMKFLHRRCNSVSQRMTNAKFAEQDMVHLSGEEEEVSVSCACNYSSMFAHLCPIPI